eukprot:3913953-Prymnesium_polylepis.3
MLCDDLLDAVERAIRVAVTAAAPSLAEEDPTIVLRSIAASLIAQAAELEDATAAAESSTQTLDEGLIMDSSPNQKGGPKAQAGVRGGGDRA